MCPWMGKKKKTTVNHISALVMKYLLATLTSVGNVNYYKNKNSPTSTKKRPKWLHELPEHMTELVRLPCVKACVVGNSVNTKFAANTAPA